MKLEFKPEDFSHSEDWDSAEDFAVDIAQQANARLAEMLKDATVVYGRQNRMKMSLWMWFSNAHDEVGMDTHRARLVCIEELEK